MYVDEHREKLKTFDGWEECVKFLEKQNLPEKFAAYAAKNGLKRRNIMLNKSYDLFNSFLIAFILDDFYGEEQKIMYSNLTDPCLLKAKQVFDEGMAFPQKVVVPDSVNVEK